MSTILAVESSTLTASIAIISDGVVVLEKESGVNTHSEALLTLIDECLRERELAFSDLERIAIGAGPGSFTGLRIGMATVKGLCYATDLPLTPVSSLAALAFDGAKTAERKGLLRADTILCAVLDARRKEVYVNSYRYESGCMNSLEEEQVISAALYAEQHSGQNFILFGDGATKYRDELKGLGTILDDARQTPSAAAVGLLAATLPNAVDLALVAPTYVRLPEAQIKFPDGNPGGTFSVKNAQKRPVPGQSKGPHK